MHRPPAIRVIATAGAVGALLTLALSAPAVAGVFTVASCQADQVNFSSTAFNDFATRGMSIRRACNPEGPGIRGLVTANTVGRVAVPRGSVAMAALSAPEGTRFTSFRWAGSARRTDCRYSLQLYAEGPGIKPVPIKNVRANEGCPQPRRAQAAGYRSRTFNINGATRIVQRVICAGGGGRKSCSARSANYIRTYKATVDVADEQGPAVAIVGDTPLASGSWVAGSQPLNYDARDNVGVRKASAVIGDVSGGGEERQCTMATPEGAFAAGVPCPNGTGHITVDTKRFSEGTQPLVVRAQDAAGTPGDSQPATVRIDNSAPARVDASVEGGEAWRNSNDFALAWSNPSENDRAPIVAALAKVCPADGSACAQSERPGDGIARLPVEVAGPGEWTVSVWRRDAAGNADPTAASVPVTLRYDPEPPQVSFEASPSSDPTVVTAAVTDKVSGLAGGTIEISAEGATTWQELGTQQDGSRLVARIDDSRFAAGNYVLRATARDKANNQASTSQRADGEVMRVTLPLRIPSVMQAGVVRHRIVRRIERRGGKRRTVRRRVTEMRPVGGVRFGKQARIAGSLTNRDGQGIPNAEIQVLAASEVHSEQLVGALRTDASGNYTYNAAGSYSRTLRFVYAGSPMTLPAERQVRLVVPGASTIRVSRRRVLNGRTVMFSGQVRSLPVPPGGKLIQLEVRLRSGWQTFRTVRSDSAGRWAVPYRFARTRGVERYRFRARLPREAGFAFGDAVSRSVRVTVRGR